LAKLGKIEKPKVSDFAESRRLFCLPLIPQINQKDLTDNLKKSIEKFWVQVASKIENLERMGKVSHVFVESVTKEGESGLDMVKQLSEEFHGIVKEKVDKGAELVVVENEEVLNEFLEWSLCLSIIRRSQKVLTKIFELHQDARDRRNKEIANKINQTLKKNDCGLLVMTDENRLQIQPILSSDIQVFLIHPPTFNDIIQDFREFLQKQSQALHQR
jgi:C4-dicarboxylate-specific signal transduction histidine kinase